MSRMRCKCGNVLSNTKCPNDVQLTVYTDREWCGDGGVVDAFGEGLDIPRRKNDVWICPLCKRIYVSNFGYNPPIAVYSLEEWSGEEYFGIPEIGSKKVRRECMDSMVILLREGDRKNEIVRLLGGDKVCEDITGERYSKELSDYEHFYLDFQSPEFAGYTEEELAKVPYKTEQVCVVSFYPPDVVLYISGKLAEYDGGLFVDDDMGHIESIKSYRERLLKGEIFPIDFDDE
ncbi:MAG: hypothetical protein NC078_07060 [Ruminococcus sp.]|nr:hypothetical protein [Ruminococcus sp.]